MSSVQRLRTFVNERLSAAAEEIVGVFVKTIVEYEEQIRLFDSVWKPEIKLHRIELSRHHVDKEQDVLADLQVCNQDGNPIVHQEDSVPTQVKEKQRASQEEVKQETEAFMLTPTDEFYCSQTDANDNQQLFSHNSPVTESQDLHQQQRDCKEEQVLAEQQLCDPNQSWSQDQEDPDLPTSKDEQEEHLVVKHEADVFRLSPAHEKSDHSEPQPLSDPQLLSDSSQDQKRPKHRESNQIRNTKERDCKNRSERKDVHNSNKSKIDYSTGTRKKSFTCDTCGKAFKYRSQFNKHLKIHTGQKPYACDKCDKRFKYRCNVSVHMRTHTGERPVTCNTCGKGFRYRCECLAHMRIHTGEKPYSCETCGKRFFCASSLKFHIKTHTGERPYSCETCGKRFIRRCALNDHTRTHSDEKPHSCNTCGKRFKARTSARNHMKRHTGEKS